MSEKAGKIPVLYLAPWVDYGGSDKSTIDWFRWIDRDRFAPSLITTQPSPNRRLAEISPFADEVWALPDLMPAEHMPGFIFDFLQSRNVRVLHLMNSRLGYELLPDLACLPSPPAVVAQLHVEEADRSGYVRYVTTRYGNLIDGFSISNEHVARAVQEYGIPRDKTRVIYTGVDAEEEFSPDRAEPIEDLPSDRLHILFAARLVAQKDPLLMVDVASALHDRGVRFQLHVVGEGDLERDVRERVDARGLDDHVLMHPPTPGLQRWYAACDALLLTSVFEGVPCVIFEAMAMGLPIVAPALAGSNELLGENDDGLVEPRDSVEGYVETLARLAEDRSYRLSRGRNMRARARERFSLQQMADSHAELYDEILKKPTAAATGKTIPSPIRFTNRPLFGTPLVSILVPHFNQVRFLGDCIDSIRAQTYPEIELIVVDDASTEPGAKEALDEFEAEDVTVMRLTENSGPSRARNVGLDHCSGRYVLPMDADNLLLPDAVENLVEQLSTAGEEVGFIYPNLQFFGNREDYHEAPPYNLYELLQSNYCDTCSLFDREVFDAGQRYGEEIHHGHEDWDFVLRLAAAGIRGEPAHGPTVRYRKWGFNRSDSVEHASDPFHEVLAENSPFKGLEAEVKAEERPAVSIVGLEPVDVEAETGRALAAGLAAQTCIDVELIARFDGRWPSQSEVPQVRRIPPALAASPLDVLRQARSILRGRFVAVTSETGSALLADPAFVEKVLRRFATSDDELDAIAFVDAGADGRFSFRALSPEDGDPDAVPHTVVWRMEAEKELPWGLHADPDDPVPSIVRLLSGGGAQVEWRHVPTAGSRRPDPAKDVATPPPDSSRWHHLASENGDRPAAEPLLPGTGRYRVPRWEASSWMPALSTLVIRYRERYGDRRVVISGPPPTGFVPEWILGAIRCTSLEGTARVVRINGDYTALPRGEWNSAPADADEIGYAELARLPQMDILALASHRTTGQRTLVAIPDDPLLSEVDVIRTLGHLEPCPARPREIPETQRPDGLLGLVKTVDHRARRHRYAVGSVPEGEPIGELGALAESELQGSIAVWIVDGFLVTERHRPAVGRPGLLAAARWALEPAAWGGLASLLSRARVLVRRSAVSATRLAKPRRPVAQPGGKPVGWLYDTARPGHTPLYASYHPVNGDQLLTRSPEDAAQMGYGPPELVGFLRLAAPVTGDLDQRPLAVPWARRFGAVPRSG